MSITIDSPLKSREAVNDTSTPNANSNSKFSKIEKRILALGLMGLLLSLGMLFFLSTVSSPRKTSGLVNISQAMNDVRYRSKNSFFFQPAGAGESLEIGDTLFTGPSSLARIEFKDLKTGMTIGEMSQVKIQVQGNIVQLVLGFGNIEANLQADESVAIVGTDIKVESLGKDGAKVKLVKNNDGQISYELLQGAARTSSHNSATDLKLKQKMITKSEQNIEKTLNFDSIELLSPENGHLFTSGETKLTAQSDSKNPIHIEVGSREKMSDLKIIRDDNISTAFFESPKISARQKFFWRAYETQQGKRTPNESELRFFFIDPPEVEMIVPFTGVTMGANFEILFQSTQASKLGSTERHQLILDGKNMHKILPVAQGETKYAIQGLADGTYHLQAQLLKNGEVWSKSTRVKFSVEDITPLGPPELRTNSLTHLLTKSLINDGINIEAIQKTRNITDFNFEIINPDGSISETPQKKALRLYPKKAGVYKIRAQSVERKKSPWSASLSVEFKDEALKIVLDSGKYEFISDPSKKNQMFAVSGNVTGVWTAPVKLDTEGAVASEISSDGRSFKAFFKNSGQLKIKARAGASSAERSVAISVLSPGPSLIKPAHRTKILMLSKAEQPVLFEWADLKSTEGYIFELQEKGVSTKKSVNIREPRISIKLKPGSYSWRVRIKPKSTTSQSSWSVWNQIDISQK